MMWKYARSWVLLAVLTVLTAVANGQTPWIRPRAGILRWKWNEYMRGLEVVEESGALPSAGFAAGIPLVTSNLELRVAADLFGGDVAYEGYLQSLNGDLVPWSSHTEYIGAHGETLVFARLSRKRPIDVFLGGGLEGSVWRRGIGKSFGGSMSQYGYEEYWTMLAARVAVEVAVPLVSNLQGRAGGHISLPLAAEETVDLSNVGGPEDVDLEPDAQPGWGIKVALHLQALELGFEYQKREFDRSPTTYIGDIPVCQPESKLETAFFYAGWRF